MIWTAGPAGSIGAIREQSAGSLPRQTAAQRHPYERARSRGIGGTDGDDDPVEAGERHADAGAIPACAIACFSRLISS